MRAGSSTSRGQGGEGRFHRSPPPFLFFHFKHPLLSSLLAPRRPRRPQGPQGAWSFTVAFPPLERPLDNDFMGRPNRLDEDGLLKMVDRRKPDIDYSDATIILKSIGLAQTQRGHQERPV